MVRNQHVLKLIRFRKLRMLLSNKADSNTGTWRTCSGEKLTPLWQDDLINLMHQTLQLTHRQNKSQHMKVKIKETALLVVQEDTQSFTVVQSLYPDILWIHCGCFSKVNNPVSTTDPGSDSVKSYGCSSQWSTISLQCSLLALKCISFSIKGVFIYCLHNEY